MVYFIYSEYYKKGGKIMAINKLAESTSLVLKLDGGMIDGKVKTINRTFSKVKNSATEENVYATGTAISSLTADSLLGVIMKETSTLIEE